MSSDCLVPAAGRSSRMGEWKPVLPFGDATIIETVVGTALAACRRVILVTGYRSGELEELFRGNHRVTTVRNDGWERGMFSSIYEGAGALTGAAFFLTPADMPGVVSAVYSALETSIGDAGAALPVFGGRRGHPVLLGPAVRDAVLSMDPGRATMRDVLRNLRIREVPWSDDSVLRDIDTPADYAELRREGETRS